MPRLPRLVLPGGSLHVIQRGNNRTRTFPSADDFGRYYETLLDASRRFGCAIHAYTLMPNHVHLLITADDAAGPSRMMQMIGRRYVRWINSRYDRTGSLWEGRFKSSSINSDRYFLACSRYIELNPVRARLVDDPRRYRWSSYRHNALGETDALITPHVLYESLGSTCLDRRTSYRALFEQPLESATIEQIRRATQRGTALGQGNRGQSRGSE